MDISKALGGIRLIGSKKIKSKYSTPKKGTKRRLIINLMLRPDGVSLQEVHEYGLNKDTFSKDMEWLRNDCGFDTAVIGRRPIPNSNRTSNVYKIIGRYYWNGKYRSFLKS